ncbi:MAG: diaminopimelate dehydrogenase, partial [Oscillospiraceae bacterium]|nr:diaminopimelate dehydrogenase [Oscillospiraceae bacterium]
MRIAICGYGNLGRGVEAALRQTTDMKAIGVFTRRDPKNLQTVTGVPVFSADEIDAHRDEIDVVILCGG